MTGTISPPHRSPNWRVWYFPPHSPKEPVLFRQNNMMTGLNPWSLRDRCTRSEHWVSPPAHWICRGARAPTTAWQTASNILEFREGVNKVHRVRNSQAPLLILSPSNTATVHDKYPNCLCHCDLFVREQSAITRGIAPDDLKTFGAMRSAYCTRQIGVSAMAKRKINA